jgi:hypothetical protein
MNLPYHPIPSINATLNGGVKQSKSTAPLKHLTSKPCHVVIKYAFSCASHDEEVLCVTSRPHLHIKYAFSCASHDEEVLCVTSRPHLHIKYAFSCASHLHIKYAFLYDFQEKQKHVMW